jgi:pilus assembly protein Flp/PilA
MKTALNAVKQFFTSEDGPTAVEYAVLLALIIVACITIVTQLGERVEGVFTEARDALPEVGG